MLKKPGIGDEPRSTNIWFKYAPTPNFPLEIKTSDIRHGKKQLALCKWPQIIFLFALCLVFLGNGLVKIVLVMIYLSVFIFIAMVDYVFVDNASGSLVRTIFVPGLRYMASLKIQSLKKEHIPVALSMRRDPATFEFVVCRGINDNPLLSGVSTYLVIYSLAILIVS
jgi:hypothetical protein